MDGWVVVELAPDTVVADVLLRFGVLRHPLNLCHIVDQ